MSCIEQRLPQTKRILCRVLEGSPRQLGQAHGVLVRQVYGSARRALKSSDYWRYCRRPFPVSLLDQLHNYHLAQRLRRSLGRKARAAEYIAGMRAEPGVSAGMIYFLLLSEVLGADRSRIAQGLGCSGIILGGEGEPLIGKNFDYQYPLAPYQALLVRKEKERLPYAAFTPILMPFGGQLCMNCRGLTISYNYAYSRKKNCPGGLPASYLVHEMSGSCADANEAVELARGRGYTIGNGASLAVVDPHRRVARVREPGASRHMTRAPFSGAEADPRLRKQTSTSPLGPWTHCGTP